MPLPSFSALVPACLAARADVARDQVELDLAVPPSVLAAHRRPGQFVKVRVAADDGSLEEGLFAMANAPGEPVGDGTRLRFLLRTNNPDGGEAAAHLATMSVGDPLEISEPAGDGFDLSRARGRHLAFVATGTAIAPARAGLETVLRHPVGASTVSLDLGLRSPAHLAIARDLHRYATLGVEVHLHYSEPQPGGEVLGVLAHEALLARLVATERTHDTLVVAVGQPEVVSALRARLPELGGRAEDVISNY